jgi:hypothetical protein
VENEAENRCIEYNNPKGSIPELTVICKSLGELLTPAAALHSLPQGLATAGGNIFRTQNLASPVNVS